MSIPHLEDGRNETETVGTSVLSVFGGTNWTVADAKPGAQRTINLHNISGGDVYFKKVTYNTTLTGLVSATDRNGVLSSGQTASVTLPFGQMLVVLSASSSEVNAEEIIHVA